MKNIIYTLAFLLSFSAFSQVDISEVSISYEGDGIYKFSAVYSGYYSGKINNAIDKSVAEFVCASRSKFL